MDITNFCELSINGKESIKSPVFYNGRMYCTNGHVMASIPTNRHDSKYDRLGGSMEKMIEFSESGFESPSDVVVSATTCSYCKGAKLIQQIECCECDGDGEVEFENTYSLYSPKCKTCDGEGVVIEIGTGGHCTQCHGIGVTANIMDVVNLHGVFVNPNYYMMAACFDGVKFKSEESGKLLFIADGGVRGVIMGMKI